MKGASFRSLLFWLSASITAASIAAASIAAASIVAASMVAASAVACAAPVQQARQAARADDALHLFILSGQSNMVGLDPSRSFTPMLEREFGKDRVLVVKDAAGGQPIYRWHKAWNMPGAPVPARRGDLYERLMRKVRAELARHAKSRAIASVTFVWMQGERDARMRWAAVYADSLRAVLAQVSKDLGRDGDDINCVVGRLSDFDLANKRYRNWRELRQAQVAFADESPRRAWIDTDDLNDGFNRRGKAIQNDLHYSVKGYDELGRRFARAAIDLIARGRKRAGAAKRPHIILAMADDQGWGDTGYNGHPFVKTPTLDAMAREGFVFDRFYAAAPICSPTRASVLTGRHPIRCKVTSHGRYMRPHEQTLAETLKAAGYVTGIFGKVHLGSGQPGSPCNPTGMGFDAWSIGLNFFDNDPYMSRNGRVEHRRGKGSALLVDDALEFLRKHKDGESPLFTVVWFPSPHDPHREVPAGPALYEGAKRAGYYREITLLDQQLGRLRDGLREMGLADDTILWFCSDNGGLVAKTSCGRGRKGVLYEGGVRVPAVVEWPARALKGRSALPVSTSDLYPTLLAMAGVDLVAPHRLDGIDVRGVFDGSMRTRAKPLGFWHKFQGGQATWSDRILKAVMEKQQAGAPTPHNPARMKKDVDAFPRFAEGVATGHAAWLDWPWKLHRIEGETYELYNLAEDPMEASDRAEAEVEKPRLARMKRELGAWMRSVVRSLNGEDYRPRVQRK